MTRRKAVAAGGGPVLPCGTAEALAEAAGQVAGRPDLSGSGDGGFTLALVNQVWRALWRGDGPATPGLDGMQRDAVTAALKGIGPRDPLEGMLAAQMVATHEAAMACFHRAHVPGRRPELRQADLAQANKLVRSYAALLEALNRHRGKGQQTMRVEHVHVHPGGQAIVGAVNQTPGGGADRGRYSA